MASLEEPRVPNLQASGTPERAAPLRPAPVPGAASSAWGGGWAVSRAPLALVLAAPGRSSSSSTTSSSSPGPAYFWPPPPTTAAPAWQVPARLPGRAGGGGRAAAAPGSGLPGDTERAGSCGRRRRLLLSPALQGWLLPARAQGPRPLLPPPPPPRLALGAFSLRGTRARPGPCSCSCSCSGSSPGSSLGASLGASPGRGGGAAGFALCSPDMEDGPSNHASCFRRLTECFLSPSECA